MSSGEGFLRLPDGGEGSWAEVHSAGLREHRGEHPLDGQEPPSAAGLAQPTGTQEQNRSLKRFLCGPLHSTPS